MNRRNGKFRKIMKSNSARCNGIIESEKMKGSERGYLLNISCNHGWKEILGVYFYDSNSF